MEGSGRVGSAAGAGPAPRPRWPVVDPRRHGREPGDSGRGAAQDAEEVRHRQRQRRQGAMCAAWFEHTGQAITDHDRADALWCRSSVATGRRPDGAAGRQVAAIRRLKTSFPPAAWTCPSGAMCAGRGSSAPGGRSPTRTSWRTARSTSAHGRRCTRTGAEAKAARPPPQAVGPPAEGLIKTITTTGWGRWPWSVRACTAGGPGERLHPSNERNHPWPTSLSASPS